MKLVKDNKELALLRTNSSLISGGPRGTSLTFVFRCKYLPCRKPTFVGIFTNYESFVPLHHKMDFNSLNVKVAII